MEHLVASVRFSGIQRMLFDSSWPLQVRSQEQSTLSIHIDGRTAEIIQRTYAWDTFASPSKPPVDSGTVAVVDGSKVFMIFLSYDGTNK